MIDLIAQVLAIFAKNNTLTLLVLLVGLVALNLALGNQRIRKGYKEDHEAAKREGRAYALPPDWKRVSWKHGIEVLVITFVVIILDTWLSLRFGQETVQVAIFVALMMPLTIANIWKLFVRGEWWAVRYQFRVDMKQQVSEDSGLLGYLWDEMLRAVGR